MDGAAIQVSFAQGGRLRHEPYIDSGDAESNSRVFEELEERSQQINEAYGRTLTFDSLVGRQACRIADYTSGDVEELGRHDEFIEWFFDAGERLPPCFHLGASFKSPRFPKSDWKPEPRCRTQ